jgi:hypothetical protein
MSLRPTQGDEKRLGSATTFYGTVALSFVIPKAKPRDLQFRGPFLETRNLLPPQICHLDRSVVERSAVLFRLSHS